jgi:hypothetical protein
MIIAHEGLDGSGKTAGMVLDAQAALKREAKKKDGKEVWFLANKVEGCRTLEHPLQMLYLTNSIIFLDELQRFNPADGTKIDEITHHIISTHRHDHNVIHWSSQAWEFVHPFWRRETAYVWKYHAVWRDLITGDSKIHLHSRRLMSGIDRELGRRRPDIIKKKSFWITKRLTSLYDTHNKISVAMSKKGTAEIAAAIRDPRELPPEPLEDTLGDGEYQYVPLDKEPQPHDNE